MIDDDSDCRGENDFSYYHFAPMRLWLVVVIDDVELKISYHLIHFVAN